MIHCVLCSCRFQPDRGFSGADGDQSREGPVQFEKSVEEDPFGLNKFLTEAKKAKRPADDVGRTPGLSKAKKPKY